MAGLSHYCERDHQRTGTGDDCRQEYWKRRHKLNWTGRSNSERRGKRYKRWNQRHFQGLHDRSAECVYCVHKGEIRRCFPSATSVGEPVEEVRVGWRRRPGCTLTKRCGGSKLPTRGFNDPTLRRIIRRHPVGPSSSPQDPSEEPDRTSDSPRSTTPSSRNRETPGKVIQRHFIFVRHIGNFFNTRFRYQTWSDFVRKDELLVSRHFFLYISFTWARFSF
jgi:hypothetical protein